MKRLLLATLLIVSSCVTINKQPAPQSEEEEEVVERPWSGPGLYWGVYINTEGDYWNHYNHYHNNDHRDYRHGHPGGEGHSGGGHHGGGGHR